MSEIKCLLCQSNKIELIGSIDTLQLSKLYRSRAGVNVKRFFEKDNIELYKCNDCDLEFYSPQITGDGKFYDELQGYHGYFLKDKAEYREAAKYISVNDDVLEIGCGEGSFADLIKYKSYVGLEYSDKAIEKAKNKKLNVLKQNIGEHANVAKEKYDVICFFQVLEHIEKPGEFIGFALHCLKKGGKLIIAVPSNDSFIKNAINFYLNMPPHHVSKWSNKNLVKVAEIFDLKIETIIQEPLHLIHKHFFLKTRIYNKLSAFFRVKQKHVDTGLTNTILYSASAITAFIVAPFLKTKKEINGQSVLCIYNK